MRLSIRIATIGSLVSLLAATSMSHAFDDEAVAKLSEAARIGAKFVCQGCNLSGANLTGAKLESTSLEATRLCRTTLPDGTTADGGC